MKVSELIEVLNELDGEKEVLVSENTYFGFHPEYILDSPSAITINSSKSILVPRDDRFRVIWKSRFGKI